MSLWDSLFGHLRVPVAQILLTRNDIADVSLEIGSTVDLCLSSCCSELNMSMLKTLSRNFLTWVWFLLSTRMTL